MTRAHKVPSASPRRGRPAVEVRCSPGERTPHAIAETLRAGGFTTAGAAGPSHKGRRTLLVVCSRCGTEQAQKVQDLQKGRRPRCGVCERIARGEPVTPSAPPKRGPGRPREIEGEQDRITFRAGA